MGRVGFMRMVCRYYKNLRPRGMGGGMERDWKYENIGDEYVGGCECICEDTGYVRYEGCRLISQEYNDICNIGTGYIWV